MNSSLIARGGVPVQLDRERVVFFNMEALSLLYRKYGANFWRELYIPTENEEGKPGPPLIKDIEPLQFFLYAGLQADAKEHGEELTLEATADFIRPLNYQPIAGAISRALTFDYGAPVPKGKAGAVAASPAAAAPAKKGRKASTSRKPRASR